MVSALYCSPERLDTLISTYCGSTNNTDTTTFNDIVRNLRIHFRCAPDFNMFTSEQLDRIVRKTLDDPRRVGTTHQRHLTTSALLHHECSPETLRYACAYRGYFADVYHANAMLNPNCPDDAKVYAFLNN